MVLHGTCFVASTSHYAPVRASFYLDCVSHAVPSTEEAAEQAQKVAKLCAIKRRKFAKRHVVDDLDTSLCHKPKFLYDAHGGPQPQWWKCCSEKPVDQGSVLSKMINFTTANTPPSEYWCKKVRPLSAMASGENMRVGNSIICFETEKAGRMVDGCVCFNPKQECVNIGLTGREPDPVDADDRAAPSPDVASFTDKAKAKFKKLNPFDRTPMQPEVAFL
eukprot:GEMP01069356.1.p1 GENE.GEMP01069356.1~~GEMP01069356.1.p1  ORF type:complete len:219 (+),score=44.94 GEMP01069356.1:260-916(+)